MEQFTEPVEGQHDVQETEADSIRLDAPYLSRFVVQTLGLTIYNAFLDQFFIPDNNQA